MAIQDSATHSIVGEASLQELEESLRGELIRPADAGYDEARAVWNGAIDKHPAAIVRWQPPRAFLCGADRKGTVR